MNFRDRLSSHQTLLLDGAMGTELFKRGVQNAGEANASNPDAVLLVYKAYLDAGSAALITNTLTMNRLYIETHHLDLNVRAVNMAGAKLARKAAGPDRPVLGNLSSTGHLLKPYGTYEDADFVQTFREQAQLLAESGVDAFIMETFFDLREALCCLKACKEAADLPVIASMAFDSDADNGRTVMGDKAGDCAKKLAEAGAAAVGANCGKLDPLQMARVIAAMRKETALPLLAEPNAGKPKLVNGKTVFEMQPDRFAEGVMECVKAGATLIGGCCGTTPDHIRAVKALL
jgi:5-methyltetrahydrofolate--homocysteine methyltransferase